MGLEIGRDPMAHVFDVTDDGRHRKGGFHQHPLVPFATTADFEVGRIAFRRVKAAIRQQNRLVLENLDQRLEPRVVGFGRRPYPPHDLSEVIQSDAPFGAHNPAVVGEPRCTEESRIAPPANGMNQFDAVAVDDAQQRGLGQEAVSPLSLRLDAPEKAGALGQTGKPGGVIAAQPAIKRPSANAFKSEQQANCDEFAGVETRLGVVADIFHVVISLPGKTVR